MSAYSHIKTCIRCRSELTELIKDFLGKPIKIRRCPNCTYKFVILTNSENVTTILFIRSGNYRVSFWDQPKRNYQCTIDFISSLTGVTSNATYNGFIQEQTLLLGERSARICSIDEPVNFDFSDPEKFDRKVKMLVTFS